MTAADTLRGVQVMKVQVSKRRSVMIFLVAVLVTLALTNTAVAQEAAGFDGYIQSGTCAAPETEDPVRIDLDDGRQDYAVEPYLAKIEGSDGTVTIAYYGAPLAPGFSVATIFVDEAVFSLVITDPTTGEPVACGDILEPDDENLCRDRYGAGAAPAGRGLGSSGLCRDRADPNGTGARHHFHASAHSPEHRIGGFRAGRGNPGGYSGQLATLRSPIAGDSRSPRRRRHDVFVVHVGIETSIDGVQP